MNNAAYYIPVVVRENAKLKALALVGEGYIQARQTLECPICSAKYLFLCDRKDSGRTQSATLRHEEAVHYFASKIQESHQNGHIEDVLVLPYELHMVGSSPKDAAILSLVDLPGRKAS
jgi:hypothetical protein